MRVFQVYIANKKNKSLSLELSVEISGKVHFIRSQKGKIVLSPELLLKKQPIYKLGSNLSVIFDHLTKSELKYFENHLDNELYKPDSSNALNYVCENAIPRYFYLKDDNYDMMKGGLRYYNKDRLEKLRSKHSWLTQFGRVIKVISIYIMYSKMKFLQKQSHSNEKKLSRTKTYMENGKQSFTFLQRLTVMGKSQKTITVI